MPLRIHNHLLGAPPCIGSMEEDGQKTWETTLWPFVADTDSQTRSPRFGAELEVLIVAKN